MIQIELPGKGSTGRPKQRFMDEVNEDMKIVSVTRKMQVTEKVRKFTVSTPNWEKTKEEKKLYYYCSLA